MEINLNELGRVRFKNGFILLDTLDSINFERRDNGELFNESRVTTHSYKGSIIDYMTITGKHDPIELLYCLGKYNIENDSIEVDEKKLLADYLIKFANTNEYEKLRMYDFLYRKKDDKWEQLERMAEKEFIKGKSPFDKDYKAPVAPINKEVKEIYAFSLEELAKEHVRNWGIDNWKRVLINTLSEKYTREIPYITYLNWVSKVFQDLSYIMFVSNEQEIEIEFEQLSLFKQEDKKGNASFDMSKDEIIIEKLGLKISFNYDNNLNIKNLKLIYADKHGVMITRNII